MGRVQQIIGRYGLVGTALVSLDRITRAVGLSVISYSNLAAKPPPREDAAARERFEHIARTNTWGSKESLSGSGSEVRRTARYRQSLTDLLIARKFGSMFDAPCGDFNWMRLLLKALPIDYVGGDISLTVVERNNALFPQYQFIEFDITKDSFPLADVWHCRDCLFHLSYQDIELALRNFLDSRIPYALITNHCGLIRNVDVASGGWRYLNLRRRPFAFPAPERALSDYGLGDQPRVVGLWSRAQIGEAMAND